MLSRRFILWGTLVLLFAFGWLDKRLKEETHKPAARQEEQAAEEQAAAWSETVNGLQARLELKQLRDETSRVAVRLHLRNVAQEPGPIRLLWSPGRYFFIPMTFRAVDAAGKDVRGGGGLVEGMLKRHPAELQVPNGESISLGLSGSSFYGSIYSVAAIDLGPGYHLSLKKEDGPCSLLSVLEIGEGKEGDSPPGQWHGRIELPPVPIPVTVYHFPVANIYNPSVAAPIGLMVSVVFIGWLAKRRAVRMG